MRQRVISTFLVCNRITNGEHNKKLDGILALVFRILDRFQNTAIIREACNIAHFSLRNFGDATRNLYSIGIFIIKRLDLKWTECVT